MRSLLLAGVLAIGCTRPVLAEPCAQPPQLTGVMLGAGVREAMFRSADGATATVGEGAAFGPYQVIAIEADQVRLRCGAETYALSLAGNPAVRSALVASRLSAASRADMLQAELDNDK